MAKNVDIRAKIHVHFFNQNLMIVSDAGSGSASSTYVPIERDGENVYAFCDRFCRSAGAAGGLSRRKLYFFNREGHLMQIERPRQSGVDIYPVLGAEKQRIDSFAAAHPHLFFLQKSAV